MNYRETEVTETLSGHRYEPASRQSAAALAGAATEALHRRPALPDRKPAPPNGLAPWQVLRVRDYVELQLGEAIHVACLARIAKLSASHFARAFKASFGMAPATYVAVRRVERAKSLMLSTNDPLCRISLDCGFSDQSHLSRVFSRRVGESPSHWRRWNKAG